MPRYNKKNKPIVYDLLTSFVPHRGPGEYEIYDRHNLVLWAIAEDRVTPSAASVYVDHSLYGEAFTYNTISAYSDTSPSSMLGGKPPNSVFRFPRVIMRNTSTSQWSFGDKSQYSFTDGSGQDQEFTFCAWVYIDDSWNGSSQIAIINKRDNGNTLYEYKFSIESDGTGSGKMPLGITIYDPATGNSDAWRVQTVRLSSDVDSQDEFDFALPENRERWIHVAATYNGKAQTYTGLEPNGSINYSYKTPLKLFIDGRFYYNRMVPFSGTYTGMGDTSEPLYIGCRPDGANPSSNSFRLADVCMFKHRAFDEREIKAIMNATLTGMHGPSTGYLNNPPRVIQHILDNATGSYPTILRTTGRESTLGNTRSTYDDTRPIKYYDGKPLSEPEHLVTYPDVLDIMDHDRYRGNWIASPNNDDPSMMAPGEVKPFVSDQRLTFSIDQRGEIGYPKRSKEFRTWESASEGFQNQLGRKKVNFEPFDETRIYLDHSAYYMTGTSPSVYPGFSSPLDDKIQIKIELPSGEDSIASRFAYNATIGDYGSAYVGVGDDNPKRAGVGTEFSGSNHTGFLYYNRVSRRWEDQGLNDPVTGESTNYNMFEMENDEMWDAITDVGYQYINTSDIPAAGYNNDGKVRRLSTVNRAFQFCQSSHTAFSARSYEDLLHLGYNTIGAPTMQGMAPFSKTFHATASCVFDMSNYIAHPFVLEKVVLDIPVLIRRKNGNIYSGQNYSGGSPNTLACDSSLRDIDNYVFFLYRQERSGKSPDNPAGSRDNSQDSAFDIENSKRFIICSGSVAAYNPEIFLPNIQASIDELGLPHSPAVEVKLKWVFGDKRFPQIISGSDAAGLEASFTGSLRIEMTPAVPTSQFLGGSRAPIRSWGSSNNTSAGAKISTFGSIVIQDFWAGGTTFPSMSFRSPKSSPSSTIGKSGQGSRSQFNCKWPHLDKPDNFKAQWPPGMMLTGARWAATGSNLFPWPNREITTKSNPRFQMVGMYTALNSYAANPDPLRRPEKYGAVFPGFPYIGGSTSGTGGGYGYGPNDVLGPITKVPMATDPRPVRNPLGLQSRAEYESPDSQQRFNLELPDFVNASNPGAYRNMPIVHGREAISTPSPYILLPTDQLIIGLDAGISANINSGSNPSPADNDYDNWSKLFNAPAGATAIDSICEISGSFMKILSGSAASITLFGSMVKRNREKLFELNQNLTSDAIHEALHFDNPVVDQFVVPGRFGVQGGSTSNMVLGRFGHDKSTIEAFLRGNKPVSYAGGPPYPAGQTLKDTRTPGRAVYGNYGRGDSLELLKQTRGFPTEGPNQNLRSNDILPMSDRLFRDDRHGMMHWNTNFIDSLGHGPLLRTTKCVDNAERFFDTLMPDIGDYCKRSHLISIVDKKSGIRTIYAGLNDNWAPSNSGGHALLGDGAGCILNESSSYDLKNNKLCANKYAWPYHHMQTPRVLNQTYQLAVIGNIIVTGSGVSVGDNNFTNTAYPPKARPGDQWDPEWSRVIYGSQVWHSQTLQGTVTWSHTNIFASKFNVILKSRTDPVALNNVMFRKGYDFAFRKYYEGPTAGFAGSLPPASNVIGAGCDTIRLWYNVGPGGANGWSYGIQNTSAFFTSAIFRSDRWGQYRDMFEQRKYGKFFNFQNNTVAANSLASANLGGTTGFGEQEAVIQCYFVDEKNGVQMVDPYTTDSSNMSHESTSSCPYIDGHACNTGGLKDVFFMDARINCVIKGTNIHTDEGQIPVEDVTTDMRVLSYDMRDSVCRYFDITKTFSNTSDGWCKVKTKLGFELGCSLSHIIMSKSAESLELIASSAAPGDHVWAIVDQCMVDDEIISVEIFEETVEVYNMSVSEVRTYISDGILSHNLNLPSPTGVTAKGGGGILPQAVIPNT